jgi:hypothetical protein
VNARNPRLCMDGEPSPRVRRRSPLNALLTLWFTLAVTAWLVVAVAAGWLAEEKGRSPIIWFLVGLVSGPFAVVLVGLAPRGASGQYQRCPGVPRADPP